MSVLNDTKAFLGVEEDDLSFDRELIVLVNSAISVLKQIGLSSAEAISASTTPWTAVLGTRTDLDLVKNYIFMSVKLDFDPPANSFTVSALKEKLEELSWRIRTALETNVPDLYTKDYGEPIL